MFLNFADTKYFVMSSDQLRRDDNGNYVKSYSTKLSPIRQPVKDFSLGDPIPPSKEELIRNELDAAKDFEQEYIGHAGIVDYSIEEGEISTEEIEDATNIKTYLEQNGLEEAEEIGEMMGHLMADIHRLGSHGDPELDNFMYRDGDILSIDHEFYSRNSGTIDRREDLRLIESDSRTLNTPKYTSFIENFKEGYLDEIREEDELYPEIRERDEPLLLAEGLMRIKKDHEDIEPARVIERSMNLFKNTLNRTN